MNPASHHATRGQGLDEHSQSGSLETPAHVAAPAQVLGGAAPALAGSPALASPLLAPSTDDRFSPPSPRPWRLTLPDLERRDPYYRVVDANGHHVLSVAHYATDERDVMNFKLIVAAVNLVFACDAEGISDETRWGVAGSARRADATRESQTPGDDESGKLESRKGDDAAEMRDYLRFANEVAQEGGA